MFAVSKKSTTVKYEDRGLVNTQIITINADPYSALALAEFMLRTLDASGLSPSWQKSMEELAVMLRGSAHSAISASFGWPSDWVAPSD